MTQVWAQTALWLGLAMIACNAIDIGHVVPFSGQVIGESLVRLHATNSRLRRCYPVAIGRL